MGGVVFEPHLIDHRIGVGTQLTVKDIDGDDRTDIVVGSKLGTHVLLNRGTSAGLPTDDPRPEAMSAIGGEGFARGVRESNWQTPEAERASFVLPPGFAAELVAAEPEITKPMNLAFDARGRLWVTCTQEYPYPVEVGQRGRDTIKILEDRDGDGHADEVTTFADGLNIPIGIYPYKDGVICYSIPYIWFLRDIDGDGKCDTREKLYGPFDHTRDTHGMCNAFTRGFDGWLYACHGFSNHSHVAGRDGHEIDMHSGNIFRMRLDGSRLEHFTHGQVNPFGMAYDARGDLLTADCHTKPITLLLQGGYYDSFGKPHDGLGYVPNVMDHLHGSTAIGGIAIAHDGLFPSAYENSAFGGNVMTSRINRNSLIYRGASVRAQEEPDFLISGDSWFRPVDLQFGPDGALYVADFYNRIIGHYEVELDHPGRDRTSGRIWKIVYRPDDERRDAVNAQQNAASMDLGPVASLNVNRLLDTLSHEIPARRMSAADRLVDDVGHKAIAATRRVFQDSDSDTARIYAMWVLFRLGAINPDDVQAASDAKNADLRNHGFRLIGELDENWDQIVPWLIRGLRDANPLVNRTAAIAASQHRDPRLVQPLRELLRRVPQQDAHLRHAARMSLRDHLRDEANFKRMAESIRSDEVALLAGICLALKSPAAAEFVAEHIEELADTQRSRITEYIRFAMRYAREEGSVESMAILARARFQDDRDLQLELLMSLGDGFQGTSTPAAIVRWGQELARNLLAADESADVLPWEFVATRTDGTSTNAWVRSKARLAADTGKPIPLWSSFPRGEQRVGTMRSGAFVLPSQFRFSIAGHDGFPQEEPQMRNVMQVRDAQTDAILRSWSPPRDDAAQPRAWSTDDLAGRRVYVELTDGDSSNAFAWFAVGQFSVEPLNPSELPENRRHGANLAGKLRLMSLRGELAALMQETLSDIETSAALAKALGALQHDSRIRALAESMSLPTLEHGLRAKIAAAIEAGHADIELLGQVTSRVSSNEQLRVAAQLASDTVGLEALLELWEDGNAGLRPLSQPAVKRQLELLASDPQKQRLGRLAERIPDEARELRQLMAARNRSFLRDSGSVDQGKQLFTKYCATCHQVAAEGQKVGPNLDGVGNRGLVRLSEDVLAPNRHVDAAFRAATIVTEQGRAITGLVKSETPAQITVFDGMGKEHVIAVETIEDRLESVFSPMPANFGDVLSDQQYRDLMAYLLTLNR